MGTRRSRLHLRADRSSFHHHTNLSPTLFGQKIRREKSSQNRSTPPFRRVFLVPLGYLTAPSSPRKHLDRPRQRPRKSHHSIHCLRKCASRRIWRNHGLSSIGRIARTYRRTRTSRMDLFLAGQKLTLPRFRNHPCTRCASTQHKNRK